MPDRLSVPPPAGTEEARQWAEVVSDLHYVGSIIVERGETFLPGENVDEIRIAWQEITPDFGVIVNSLAPSATATAPTPTFAPERLSSAKLNGPTGSVKRNLLRRLKDNVTSFIRSDPPTDEKQRLAIEAGERYFDAGGVALNSLHACAHDVPYLGPALKVAEEAVLGLKHFLALRRSRGHTDGAQVP
jgi:hypothetical protein